LNLHISNKSTETETYSFSIEPSEGIELIIPLSPVQLEPRTMKTSPVFVNFERALLNKGSIEINIKGVGDKGFQGNQVFTLLGPDS
jgi:hypothetical protein